MTNTQTVDYSVWFGKFFCILYYSLFENFKIKKKMKKREQRNINSMLSYSLSFFFAVFFKFITDELAIIIKKKTK